VPGEARALANGVNGEERAQSRDDYKLNIMSDPFYFFGWATMLRIFPDL